MSIQWNYCESCDVWQSRHTSCLQTEWAYRLVSMSTQQEAWMQVQAILLVVRVDTMRKLLQIFTYILILDNVEVLLSVQAHNAKYHTISLTEGHSGEIHRKKYVNYHWCFTMQAKRANKSKSRHEDCKRSSETATGQLMFSQVSKTGSIYIKCERLQKNCFSCQR